MRFDVNELRNYFEINDSEKLFSLAHTYQSNITYIKEEEYVELIKMLAFILEKIYDMEDKNVQEAFFDVIKKVININFGKCAGLRYVIDLVIEKIESGYIGSFELEESLLIISSTMDKHYSNIMERFVDHKNSNVREIVKEYFDDISL